jgi:peptidoglycan/LPS O-acetylase OafA/YrhL
MASVSTLEQRPAQAAMPASLAQGLSGSQIPGLDGLRAFAVMAVVVYHFGLEFIPGGMGVLAFFVLSGFLITWLLLKEFDKSNSISLKSFYTRRSLRIFPAFYVYWLLVVGLLLLRGREVPWPQATASFFYVCNYYHAFVGHLSTGFAHTWSLGVEEQFYLFWPLAFLLLQRSRFDTARSLTLLIPLFWVHRLLLQFVWRVKEVYIYEAFDARADHLLVGCLLAIALRRKLKPGLWQSLCAHPALGLIPVALLALSAVAAQHSSVVYRNTIGFMIDPLLVAVLIVQLIAFSNTTLWGWMNWGWLRYLGRISYSTYLYQELLTYPLKQRLSALPVPLQLLATVAGIVLAASLSYFVVERPFLKLKDRLSQKAHEAA